MEALLAEVGHPTIVKVTETGLGLGAVVAVTCSWDRNKSILLAILAGVLSWFYVIYFALTREEKPGR